MKKEDVVKMERKKSSKKIYADTANGIFMVQIDSETTSISLPSTSTLKKEAVFEVIPLYWKDMKHFFLAVFPIRKNKEQNTTTLNWSVVLALSFSFLRTTQQCNKSNFSKTKKMKLWKKNSISCDFCMDHWIKWRLGILVYL